VAFVVIEGPIGAGKTSLTRILAEELSAQVMLEVVEENPFLAPFYDNPEGFAFQVQIFFLLSRYKQSLDAEQGALFYDHLISDYLFDKDFIFASLNLQGHEWELYQDLYQQLKPRLPEPDLLVYLRAQPDLLLQRIDKRGRPFEQNMQAEYLRRLGEAYDEYFKQYTGKFVVIEADQVDFVENPVDRAAVLEQILTSLKLDNLGS